MSKNWWTKSRHKAARVAETASSTAVPGLKAQLHACQCHCCPQDSLYNHCCQDCPHLSCQVWHLHICSCWWESSVELITSALGMAGANFKHSIFCNFWLSKKSTKLPSKFWNQFVWACLVISFDIFILIGWWESSVLLISRDFPPNRSNLYTHSGQVAHLCVGILRSTFLHVFVFHKYCNSILVFVPFLLVTGIVRLCQALRLNRVTSWVPTALDTGRWTLWSKHYI